MKRLSLLGVVFSAGLTAQCDLPTMVVTTAPLARPLPTVCVKSALDTITQSSTTDAPAGESPAA